MKCSKWNIRYIAGAICHRVPETQAVTLLARLEANNDRCVLSWKAPKIVATTPAKATTTKGVAKEGNRSDVRRAVKNTILPRCIVSLIRLGKFRRCCSVRRVSRARIGRVSNCSSMAIPVLNTLIGFVEVEVTEGHNEVPVQFLS